MSVADDAMGIHAWQPSVPLPFYGLLHIRCDCGKRFWGREQHAARRYRDHYWNVHIAAALASGTISINDARRMLGVPGD